MAENRFTLHLQPAFNFSAYRQDRLMANAYRQP
jgi:hypothetical protein